MGIVVCFNLITYNINVNLVRLWAFKIIKMEWTTIKIENNMASKYNIEMEVDMYTYVKNRKFEPSYGQSVEGYRVNVCSTNDRFDTFEEAIFWLEMEVGAKISDILKSEIDKGKAAAYQLNVIDVDGFLIDYYQ